MEDEEEELGRISSAVAAAIDAEAFSPPPRRAASSKKALRLASTRKMLLSDALAVVARVRPGAMLDFCPGLEPSAAAAVAAAASAAFLAFSSSSSSSSPSSSSSLTSTRSSSSASVVVAAHLDGCCYLLSVPLLGDAAGPPGPPPPLPSSSPSKSEATAAGAFSRTAPWPIVFRGQPLSPRWGDSRKEGKELAEALAPLAAKVSEVSRSTAKAAAAAAAAEAPSPSSSSSSPLDLLLPFVDLDSIPDLPTAPALNAFLLGYPVAYSVESRDEAALASRALRSGAGAGSGSKSGLALVTMTAPPLSPPPPSSSSSSPNERWKVCSFSIPLSLWEEATEGVD